MKRWFSLFLVLISAGAALAQPPRPAEFRRLTAPVPSWHLLSRLIAERGQAEKRLVLVR